MNITNAYKELGITDEAYNFGEKILGSLKDRFDKIDKIAEYNQCKVLAAMKKNRVDAACFAASTGYGYNDLGRDKIEKVYADTFHTEAALVRPQIVCGTHALTVALSANLLPGDELLSPVGKPYDTLEEVIGIRESKCSLKEYGVTYKQVDLLPDGTFDYDNIALAIGEKTKLVTIQRSKGYQTRPTFSVKQIGELIAFVKKIKPDVIVMVDNCYGEFTEKTEPVSAGADIIVGSLIKNPGGGIAETGGYIAGTKKLVEQCSYRLTCPGVGREAGCSLDQNKRMYQGLFFAPEVVANALKTATFTAAIMTQLGFECFPKPNEPRGDIITAVLMKNPENLIAFCQGVQKGSPVDSFVAPEPWDMPGYDSQVIMAAGAFNNGASIELSADAPLREPYAAYVQGGLTYATGRMGILCALQEMFEKRCLKLF